VPFKLTAPCLGRELGDRPLPTAVRSGLLVATALGGLSIAAAGQEASPSKEFAPSGARPAPKTEQGRKATVARPIPDALKFANGLLRQKKYDLAAEEYARFIKSGVTGQDLDDGRFGLANARLYQGNFGEARAAFDEFLKGAADDPRRLTARYRLGELAYLLGDLRASRSSLEEFTAATADHPGLEMAWTYLGDACFGLQEYSRARIAYERSLATHPQGRLVERAKYGLGRSLAALGERERAERVLQELAQQTKPEWIDRAWLQIGLIRKSAGLFAEAVAAFTAVERAVPGSPLVPEAQLQRALALIRLDRAAEAQPLLRSLATASLPQAARAALELATIELERKEPDAAMTTLEAALKRFPESPLVPALHYRIAEVLLKKNRLAEAQARFERVVAADPNDPWADDALEHAAQTALDRGDLASAQRLASSFVTRFPQSPLNPEVRLIEARAAAREGKHDEAVTILKALIDQPADPKGQPLAATSPAIIQAARYELALSYRALGQADLATPILAGLAQGSNGQVAVDAKFLVGQSDLDAGRYTEAIQLLKAYLSASPQGEVADVAMAHVAVAQLGLGQLDDAAKTVDSLAARFPRTKVLAPTRLRLAEAELTAHRPEPACEQFRIVAGIDRSNGELPGKSDSPKSNDANEPSIQIRALAGLGKSLWELGKPAEAAAAFAALLAKAPNDPIAPEVALAHGRALEASAQPDAAQKAYSLVIDRFAKSDQAQQAALAQARLLARAGHHDEAARAFEHLVTDEKARDTLQKVGVTPDIVLSEWGSVLLDADKQAEADRVFSRLLKEYPESPHAADARFNLAESANLAHNYAEVVRLLLPVAARKPVAPSAQPVADNRESPQLASAHKADPIDRLLPAVLYRLGRTQVELNDLPAAAATLDRLQAEFADNPYRREAQYLRAETALRQGDAALAERQLAALLDEAAPTALGKEFLATVQMKRIQCWIALKRWKDALDQAQTRKGELAAGDPAVAELDYLRGQALLGLGRLEEARAAFQAVIDIHKDGDLGAQALLMRGETYFHQDQLHEALRDFLQVDILHNAPRWQAAALLEAGKVYERLDHWADAAETYERLLSNFASEPSAVAARQRLSAVRGRAASTSSPKKS
jgi:cellulose synthase operon protein C